MTESYINKPLTAARSGDRGACSSEFNYSMDMGSPTLREVLAQAAGALNVISPTIDDANLDAPLRGFVIQQGENMNDAAGKIVFCATCTGLAPEGLMNHVEKFRDARALILPPGASPHVAMGDSPVLLQRSVDVSLEELVQVVIEAFSSSTAEGYIPGKIAVASEFDPSAYYAVRRQESALLILLSGTSEATAPAALLGLRPDRDHVVVAAAVGDARFEQYRLALHAEFPGERSVVSDGITLTVIPVESGRSSEDIASKLRSRLARAIQTGEDLPVGIGDTVPGVFALHESAASARQTLRALRFKLGIPWKSGTGAPRVATSRDVPDALALIRASDALRSQGPALADPLLVLKEHDEIHGSELLRSVLAALEFRGNMTAAAKQLGIHPNSLRARLERARELSGVDLEEPVSTLRAVAGFLASPDAHNAARRERG